MYFDKSCFHFHLPWGILWFHLWFHFWPVVFLVAWCLFSVFVLFLFFLPVVDFWFHTTVVGKNVLNCFLINYFGFIVVSGFFLLLSNKMNSLLFSLSLTLTVSMKIGKRFPVTVKGVSLCGSIPVQPACAWWLWWESWIRCEHKSCLSLWCAVSAHLGGTWSWSGRSQKQVWTQDCPLPRGRTARSGPVRSCIARLLWAGSALLGCVSYLLQPWHPCTGWSCSTGASGSSWYRLGCGLWPSGLAPRPTASDALPLWAPIMVAPVLRRQSGCEPPLCLRGLCDVSPWPWRCKPQCGDTLWNQQGWSICWAQAGACTETTVRSQPATAQLSAENAVFLLRKQASVGMRSSQAESDFSQPSY